MSGNACLIRLVFDLDSIISDCDESFIAEVIIAVDSLGEEYRQEYEKIKRFFEEFHATAVDNKYVFKDIESSLALEFLYSSPEVALNAYAS